MSIRYWRQLDEAPTPSGATLLDDGADWYVGQTKLLTQLIKSGDAQRRAIAQLAGQRFDAQLEVPVVGASIAADGDEWVVSLMQLFAPIAQRNTALDRVAAQLAASLAMTGAQDELQAAQDYIFDDDAAVLYVTVPDVSVAALKLMQQFGANDDFIVPGAGTIYTLTLTTGTYVITGDALGLLAQRVLGLTTGSYTVTGNTMGLLRQARLWLTTGVYTVSGASVGLLRQARLALTTGVYAVTGSSATLLRNLKLSLTTGVYTLTGRSMGFTWSGAAAVFTLTLTTGVYNVTGKTVGLLAQRKLSLTTGVYALTGQATGLYRQARLALTTGVYSVTGRSQGLTAARRLLLTAGNYVLSGGLMRFVYSNDVTIPADNAHIEHVSMVPTRHRIHMIAKVARSFITPRKT